MRNLCVIFALLYCISGATGCELQINNPLQPAHVIAGIWEGKSDTLTIEFNLFEIRAEPHSLSGTGFIEPDSGHSGYRYENVYGDHNHPNLTLRFDRNATSYDFSGTCVDNTTIKGIYFDGKVNHEVSLKFRPRFNIGL